MTAPVMLSTLEDGTIVRGLAGIPYEGPVLLVGYHMLLGLEIIPLMTQFLIERNIHLRGIAHPMLFPKYKEHGSTLSPFFYDAFHIMGAVPVSGANLFKLFSRKSHVLLYPGGAREALHRKGEEYKLFWPEQAEFVRMAAKFGAKIVPFGTVGEDDIGQVVLDYEDLMKIPYYRDQIRRNTEGNQEDGNGIDLVTTIKGATFYRRGKSRDYISDYLPPTHSEFIKLYESNKWFSDMTAPVMLSTLEDGTIVRGLAGIPSEGPVLLVGYHMLLGLEIISLMAQFLIERNIHVRGIAHPMLFPKYKEDGSTLSPFFYDAFRIMGAVPVSGTNLFKLLSRKSHVLLYPGGVREALHRKGEEYKLFWPEQAEFVRMAARFGAKIVPFGTVGEDDIGQVVLDYEDLMKIPYYRDQIMRNTEGNVKLRYA
ncbi:hypothetical protein CRG98_014096 [Punica granatum]|uniref:Acyltransferase n=1 Tax=Punica granatum TaxID=22663 RepID=A0A2I0KAD0_PUNGR|nr:hypothetical protein CRG98_014096 [Punica granatum]